MAKKRWEAVFLKPLSLRGWGFSLILTGTQQRFLLMAVVKVETQSFFTGDVAKPPQAVKVQLTDSQAKIICSYIIGFPNTQTKSNVNCF